MNISPEEVEQEVSKILKFDTSLNKYKTDNSKSFASAPAEATAAVHIDGIMRQIMKFNPDEVSRLPIEVQKKIMNQWVIFEKGVIQARQMEFDSAYGEAMKTVNTKVLKKVSALGEILPAKYKESIRAGTILNKLFLHQPLR